MKRILLLAAAIAAIWGLPRLSHPAVDIGKLEPVEAVRLTANGGTIAIETDTGAYGSGGTLEEAVMDLRQGAETEVFLETANKLLITGNMDRYWEEIRRLLRPSCRVCLTDGTLDLKEAAEYLAVHPPELTLNRLRAGETNWEYLIMEEGRGWLVPQ